MITVILCRWLLMNPWPGGAASAEHDARRLEVMTLTVARSPAGGAQQPPWGRLPRTW
ncbi:MAG: hypothetical protein HYY96_05725 [Candidatus Tectomicrobia bacterium]|nr:hypothetical protein [Candidatus Tectomicrobia bacterium]